MKELISLTRNKYIVNNEQFYELVLVVTEPEYDLDDNYELQKKLKVETFRINVSRETLLDVIQQLSILYQEDSDLENKDSKNNDTNEK